MLSQNQTAILLLAMNSAPLGLALYSSNREGGSGQGSLVSDSGPPLSTVKFDSLVVHFKPDEGALASERYAHLEFDIEPVREEDRSNIVQRRSQIREAVLGYFLDHSVTEVKQTGMLQMKAELIHRINKLSDTKIRMLYFAQFLIQ